MQRKECLISVAVLHHIDTWPGRVQWVLGQLLFCFSWKVYQVIPPCNTDSSAADAQVASIQMLHPVTMLVFFTSSTRAHGKCPFGTHFWGFHEQKESEWSICKMYISYLGVWNIYTAASGCECSPSYKENKFDLSGWLGGTQKVLGTVRWSLAWQESD